MYFYISYHNDFVEICHLRHVINVYMSTVLCSMHFKRKSGYGLVCVQNVYQTELEGSSGLFPQVKYVNAQTSS